MLIIIFLSGLSYPSSSPSRTIQGPTTSSVGASIGFIPCWRSWLRTKDPFSISCEAAMTSISHGPSHRRPRWQSRRYQRHCPRDKPTVLILPCLSNLSSWVKTPKFHGLVFHWDPTLSDQLLIIDGVFQSHPPNKEFLIRNSFLKTPATIIPKTQHKTKILYSQKISLSHFWANRFKQKMMDDMMDWLELLQPSI